MRQNEIERFVLHLWRAKCELDTLMPHEEEMEAWRQATRKVNFDREKEMLDEDDFGWPNYHW